MLSSTPTVTSQPTITDAISAIDTAQRSARQQQGLMDDFVTTAEKLLVEAEQILDKAERIQDSGSTVDLLIVESSTKFEGIVSLTEKVSNQVQNFSMLVENLQDNLRQIINILDHLQDSISSSGELSGRRSHEDEDEETGAGVHMFGDEGEDDNTSLTNPSKIQAIISETTKDIDSLHETVLLVYEDTQLAQEASEDLRLRISEVRGHIENLKGDYAANSRLIEQFKSLSEHIHRLTDPISHNRTQIEMGLEAVARLSDGSSKSKAALKRYFKKVNKETERQHNPVTFSQAASSKPVIVRSFLSSLLVGGVAAVINLALPIAQGLTVEPLALGQVLFIGLATYLVATIASAQAITNAEHETAGE
ncbi:MAG: hypothetical protein Q7P63_09375 [Verrucomicrobiota bacterium JB022]|nr:hypothetical protein [Verrucomicrobiota bacterium JB022]